MVLRTEWSITGSRFQCCCSMHGIASILHACTVSPPGGILRCLPGTNQVQLFWSTLLRGTAFFVVKSMETTACHTSGLLAQPWFIHIVSTWTTSYFKPPVQHSRLNGWMVVCERVCFSTILQYKPPVQACIVTAFCSAVPLGCQPQMLHGPIS